MIIKSGWWLTYPSEKCEFVSLDDGYQYIYIYNYIYIWENKMPCSKPPTSDHDDLPPRRCNFTNLGPKMWMMMDRILIYFGDPLIDWHLWWRPVSCQRFRSEAGSKMIQAPSEATRNRWTKMGWSGQKTGWYINTGGWIDKTWIQNDTHGW